MKTYALHNPYAKHPDIGKLQRALKAKDFYTGAIDNEFGPGTADACRAAKYALGYETSEISSIGGQRLLDYLNGTKPLPADYNRRAKARKSTLTTAQKQRQAIVAFCRWSIANEPNIHYSQVRPMDHVHVGLTRKLPWYSDCSEHATTAYYEAGAPDPNGLGYNGQGYTGTLLSHGTTIPLSQAKAGDLVVYTPPGAGHHVCTLLEDGNANGGNPMLCSHGRESGPNEVRFHDELAVQASLGAGHYTVKKYIKD